MLPGDSNLCIGPETVTVIKVVEGASKMTLGVNVKLQT